MADGRVVIDTKLDTTGVQSGIQSLNTILKTGIKGAIAALGISSLSSAIKAIANETQALNNSIRAASTLFGDVDVNTDALRKRMQELAIATGVSSAEIGTALYDALSSGIKASEDMSEALGFIEKSTKIATAGFSDLQSVVKATASTLNAYGLSVEETDRVQGILMQTQNLGITTVGELSNYLAEVIPTAASYSVSLEQVGAALATMTAMGTKTTMATSSLNAMLSELGKDSQKASDNLKKATAEAGMGAKTFSQLVDEGYTLTDILMLLSNYAKSSDLNLSDMFGGIEAGRAALQLATQEGEKFDEALVAMADSADLVADAFNKVLTNTERTKNAWKELMKTIGSYFSDATESAAGVAADILEKLVNTGKEASMLENAYNELTVAVKNYNDAQEEYLKTPSATSGGILAQANVDLTESLVDNVTLIGDSIKSIQKLEAENISLKEKSENTWETLRMAAEDYGLTIEDLANLHRGNSIKAGEVLNWAYPVGDYEIAAETIVNSNKKIENNNAQIVASTKELSSYIKNLFDLYREGSLDLEMFKDANVDVIGILGSYEAGFDSASTSVEKVKDSIDSLNNRLESFIKIRDSYEVGSDGWLKYSAYVDVYTEALNEAVAAQEALNKAGSNTTNEDSGPWSKDALERLSEARKKIEDSSTAYKALGDEVRGTEEKISIATNAVKTLISMGIDPADEEIQNLIADIKRWNSEINIEEDSSWKLTEAQAEMNKELDKADDLYSLLGDEYDVVSAKTSIYMKYLEELLDNGIKPTEEAITQLVEAMNKLSTPKVNAEGWEGFKDFWKEFADSENLSATIGNSFASAFEAMEDTIANAKKNISDLEEKSLDYTDKISEATKDKGELEAELLDAKARGDEKEIARTQEKIDGLQKQIEEYTALREAIDDEKKALEDGSAAFKAFGKAGLLAIAEILNGLGGQLAAQAVLSLLSMDWAGAALATGASVAAYAAATGVKTAANSFATGGIVERQPNTPITGDNHVAFVNAGELILNQAQQANLADQIRAMNESLGARSAIIVNMNGAYIYGLDEPAVGRAIYHNIETLRSEGVL